MINCEYSCYPCEYKKDIYEHLKTLEKERYIFRNRSPQFGYRNNLIKWLKKLFEKLEFSRITLHLAIFLLDFFMDSYSVKPENLTLIAFICFILAGKFEERDADIPKISEINAILEHNYVKMDIIYLEKIILTYFKWKLTVPTALHFAEYFLDYAVIREDFCKNCCNYNYVYTVIRNAVNEFLDLILEVLKMISDSFLIKEPPSFVAASCILAVRKSYSLKPNWPYQLESVSNYSESVLLNCAEHIIKFKDKNRKQRKRKVEQSPDYGYETEKGSPHSPKKKKE